MSELRISNATLTLGSYNHGGATTIGSLSGDIIRLINADLISDVNTTITAGGDKLSITENANLIINSGTLDISGSNTLETKGYASNGSIQINDDGTLIVKGSHLGTININDTAFTLDNLANSMAENSIINKGVLVIKDVDNANTTIFNNVSDYETFMKSVSAALKSTTTNQSLLTSTSDGFIVISGITLDQNAKYTLNSITKDVAIQDVVKAGTLGATGSYTASFTGIIVNGSDNASTIGVGSSLTLTGENSSALLNEGSLTNNGTLVLGGIKVDTADFNGTLYNSGTATVNSHVTFKGAVSNASSGTLTFNKGATLQDTLGITDGTSTFGGVGDCSVAGAVDIGSANNATLAVTGGTYTIKSSDYGITNYGTFAVSGGTVAVSSGTITNKNNFTISSGAVNVTGGSITNENTLAVSGGTLSLASSDKLQNNGTFNIGGGTLTSDSTTNLDLSGIVNMNSGTISLKNADLSIASGDTFTWSGGTIDTKNGIILDGGTLDIQKTEAALNALTLKGGSINTASGTTLALVNLDLNHTNPTSAKFNVNGTLNVGGTVTWDSGNDATNNQIVVGDGATFITGRSNIYTYNETNKTAI